MYNYLFANTNMKFPDDPFEQLWHAIGAVFLSWNGERAKKYRQIENIPNNYAASNKTLQIINSLIIS